MSNTMREILFRGQTRRYGEKLLNVAGDKMPSNWVYGGIFQGPNKSIIYSYEPVEKHVVYTDTIGQYTGLTDKNGNKIFEGDIIKIWTNLDCNRYYKILWGYDTAKFVAVSDNAICSFDNTYPYEIEVIGNVHDNPELLEGSNE